MGQCLTLNEDNTGFNDVIGIPAIFLLCPFIGTMANDDYCAAIVIITKLIYFRCGLQVRKPAKVLIFSLGLRAYIALPLEEAQYYIMMPSLG